MLAACGEGVNSDMSMAPADGEPFAPTAPPLVPPPLEVCASPCSGAGVSDAGAEGAAAGGDEIRVNADKAWFGRDRGVAGEGTDASEVVGEDPIGSASGKEGKCK